jgi:radical SAM superfamily enzyme YgiQ (UPF0313 family)
MGEILFLHVPKSAAKPDIMFIPLGTVALANFLKQKGLDVKIVNVFVEKKLDNNFDAVEYAEKNSFKLICIPLQWHFQTYDVIETARKIKEKIPDSKIVLGGFTASYFAEEIIKEYPFIDFVVKGDAEIPLLNLAEGKEKSEIPNLVWRKNEVVSNPQTYKLDKQMLESLSFTDFSLISNFEEYNKLALPRKEKENTWFFVYNPGIGCSVNCSFCGGSCVSQERINKRHGAMFVDAEIALRELGKLSEKSVGVWCAAFDPEHDREYYARLFRRIQEEGLKMRCKFEAWSLPTKEFIDEFKKAFADGSEILISPETGSEKVRKLNKGFYYSNDELVETLKYMGEKQVNARLYFTAGLAGETKEDFVQTLVLVNKIRTEFPKVPIHAMPIEIEPAAPLYMDNEKYGVKTSRKSIKDFYNVHQKQSSVGYSTEHFSEEDIPEIVNLVRAAGECAMKRPVFLKALTEAPVMVESVPLNMLYNLCTVCKHFNRCFC